MPQNQKWPRRLRLIRHIESEYNILRPLKAEDKLWQRFVKSYEGNPRSRRTRELALGVIKKYALPRGDHNTKVNEEAVETAIQTGRALAGDLPDIIYVSPYERTNRTLEGLIQGWPELGSVPIVQDERIREQEHGLMLLTNDWRAFFALNHAQLDLRERDGRYWYRYPNGESVPDVRLRLKDFQETLVREHAGQDVLVVTHHLVIVALRMNLERLEWHEFPRLDEDEKPINCGVWTYESTPGTGRSGQGKLILTGQNVCHYTNS